MAFGKADAIQVEGLKELRQALRDLGPNWPKEMRKANIRSAELVAEEARRKADSLGGVAGKVSPSIKAAGEQLAAKVRWGGSQFPFAAGAEFGSIKYKQFKPWRGSDANAGYFVFPAVRSTRDQLIDVYADAVDELTSRAFPD